MMEKIKPIILKLEGGLGNQLFELSAGFYLAAKLDSDLHIDQYSIPITTVHGEIESGFKPFEALQLPNSKRIKILPTLPSSIIVRLAKRSLFIKKLVTKIRLLSSNPSKLSLYIETNDVRTTEEFFNIDRPMKLHGNFQSWKIVEKAAQYGFPRIFRLVNIPKWVAELEKSINFKDSLVLHFRVGNDTRTNHNFRQPEISYYLAALTLLKSKKTFSSIYVLSDDIPRVIEMFGDKFGEDFHYLEMPTESSPAERLYVLSLFGGIVCANSTFCGWAAWSIYNSGGEVVVPVPYSDGPVLGSRDFPAKWHQLDKYSGRIVA
jgi:hypothetical protein